MNIKKGVRMKIEKVKDGTSRRRYVLYLSAVLLAVIMMLSSAIIFASDSEDVAADGKVAKNWRCGI